jgi:hypothetical protein
VKERLRELLAGGRFGEIAELAAGKKRVLGALTSLTFEPDPVLAWRAVEAMGAAADRVAEENPDYVRSHLRRLHWLISEESGGICWYAPQAMAEIVRRRPREFADYIPIILTLLDSMADEDLEHFRPGVLWAVGRLAPVAGGEIDAILPSVVACLDHHDAQVRGTAVLCLRQCGRADRFGGRKDLASDNRPVEMYVDGELVRKTVAEMAGGPATC